MTNNNSGTESRPCKDKTAIWVAVIGVVGGVLGVLLQAWFVEKQVKAIEVGKVIIAEVDHYSTDKSEQDAIVQEVFRAMIKGQLNDLNEILSEIKNKPEKDSIDSATKSQKGNSPESTSEEIQPPPKTEDNFDAKVSTSKTDFNHYRDFRSNNIFLLIAPKKEVKSCQIDWDDGASFQKVTLQKERKGGYYYTSHYYYPGKTIRNIHIKIQFKDGTRDSSELTIFTYL